jgi:hypothetical protein
MAFLLGGVTAAPSQYVRAPLRSITGKVDDHGKEPLRGAVVQVEAEDTMTIESFITDERGEYHFRNLRPDADYQVWATFRGHRSKRQEVSKFDRKPDRVLDIVIDLDKD